MSNQDFLFGADQDFPLHAESIQTQPSAEPWLVLIVDDEPQVHEVTELVMADFEFGGRHLMFLHAYSAAEARTHHHHSCHDESPLAPQARCFLLR